MRRLGPEDIDEMYERFKNEERLDSGVNNYAYDYFSIHTPREGSDSKNIQRSHYL